MENPRTNRLKGLFARSRSIDQENVPQAKTGKHKTTGGGGSSPRLPRARGALARSRSIDHQIDEEREKRQKEVQILILGGASSGKSTFIKQLRIHHGDGFPETERCQLKGPIYENLSDAINKILLAMEPLGIGFQNTENERFAAEFQHAFPSHMYQHTLMDAPPSPTPQSAALSDQKATAYHAGQLTPSPILRRNARMQTDFSQLADYFERLLPLWHDSGVQKCYARREEFDCQLAPAELHFLEHIEKLCQQNYVPTIPDILYIRKPTYGVQEHCFSSNGLDYRVIDVAGQKNQRKKWIHFFEGVAAVVFCASLSGYAETLEEDPTLNSLQDSLNSFQEVVHNKFLANTDLILFLNKRDLFEKSIEKKPLTKCFPKYTGASTPDDGIKFIQKEFLQRKPHEKQVYTHVSSAINVDVMKSVIDDIMQIIINMNLQKAGGKPL